MLDRHLIRERTDFVKNALSRRDPALGSLIDRVLQIDERFRNLQKVLDEWRAERKRLSKETEALIRVGRTGEQEDIKGRVRAINDEIDEAEAEMRETKEEMERVLLELPNLPHPTVPDGRTEEEKRVIRELNFQPKPEFEPKDHVHLAENLDLIDFKRGAKIAGSGFYILTGLGAKLERALIQLMLDVHLSEHNYREVYPPFLVRSESMTGTGQLPKFAEDLYSIPSDDLYLVPTAEVPVTNFFREEILDQLDLPLKIAAYSPCFRREAGHYGKEARGLVRVHQFNKVELVNFTSPESSYDQLETLLGEACRIIELLELPYRVTLLPAGDMGFAAAKTYDIEVYTPSGGAFYEVSSCTNFEDFQARRMNLRYRDGGKVRFLHTLNASGVALPRTYAAILENFQQADGSVRLPSVLSKYMDGILEIRRGAT